MKKHKDIWIWIKLLKRLTTFEFEKKIEFELRVNKESSNIWIWKKKLNLNWELIKTVATFEFEKKIKFE